MATGWFWVDTDHATLGASVITENEEGELSRMRVDSVLDEVDAFRRGLKEVGYVEGQNVTVEYRWADNQYDRLPALAADLVGRQVAVIVSNGPPILAAKAATSTIPIVIITGGDPVAAGLVASLARPGGNLTGVSWLSSELSPKRFELLRELVPQARVIALLVNPNSTAIQEVMSHMQDAARTNGVLLPILKASSDSEIGAAFAAIVQQQAGALIVASDPFFNGRRELFLELAARHAIPAIYSYREFATAGGLMSYGPNLTAGYHQAGIYIGRILNGAKPADLPIMQPTTFELIINLKTAKALGLTIPPSILARADEVIE